MSTGVPDTTGASGPFRDRLAALSAAQRIALGRRISRPGDRGAMPAIPRLPQPLDDGDGIAIRQTSFAQRRMWFLHEYAPHSAAYSTPRALLIRGRLDAVRLGRTIAQIVGRHDTLRSTFQMRDGDIIQIVGPGIDVPFDVTDLRSLPASNRETGARHLIEAAASRPFDLALGPLLRTLLVRTDEEEHILFAVMHHIISDGWSMTVFFRELGQIYAHLGGAGDPPAKPPIQYADFAAWQRGHALEKETAFWTKALAGAPDALDLPADRPRPPAESFRGSLRRTMIPRELTARLDALARNEGATPFMVLGAAFAILLHRHTGRSDILFGTPIANREPTDIEGLIGLFANTLVIRSDLSGNPTARESVRRLRDTALSAYAHRHVPFERLVDLLHVRRDTSRTAIIQTLFIYLDLPEMPAALGDLAVEPWPMHNGTSKFDLSWRLDRMGDHISVDAEFSIDLFDPDRIERMLGHYLVLLGAIVEDPDRRVAHLPLLDATERQRVLIDWNPAARDMPGVGCVHHLIEAAAARSPESTAIVAGNVSLTYRELDARAERIARALAAQGLEANAPVGIALDRSTDLVAGILGILKAGGAYVPIAPSYPAERQAFMLRDSGAHILLTTAGMPHLPEPGPATILCLEDLPPEAPPIPARHSPKPDDAAYIIYTSGSTGQPKGVVVTHDNLFNLAHVVRADPGLGPGDTLVSVAPISFDVAVLDTFATLSCGARLVLASDEERTDPLLLASLIESQEAAVLHATPATLRMLLWAGWPGSKNLRLWSGGEALPDDLARALHPRCESLWNLYGPTETTVYASLAKITPGDRVTIGRPMTNMQCYIVDPAGNPSPIGVPGELWVGGRGVARGYHDRPGLTAERFLPDPFSPNPRARIYRTGDLCRWLPDGRIEYLGRMDDQVKIRGFRIELGEIESALRELPEIREAAVATRDDRSGDTNLIAWVIPETDRMPTTEGIRAALRSRVPEFMLPARVIPIVALPLSPNGKVDRGALPDSPATPYAPVGWVAPRSPEESAIATIFGELLGREDVGATQNFFELGGHSLLAARAIARINAAFGVTMPLRTMFESPTAEMLASAMRSLVRDERHPSHHPIRRLPRPHRISARGMT